MLGGLCSQSIHGAGLYGMSVFILLIGIAASPPWVLLTAVNRTGGSLF